MRNKSRAADRDRGLLRIVRVNRFTIGAAVVLTGVLSSVAALAHPGSSRHGSSSAPAPSNAQPNVGSGAPNASADPNSVPADPNAQADPNAVPTDPNAVPGDQSAVPSDPSQVPVAPQSAPQGVPDSGGPPAATSGGS